MCSPRFLVFAGVALGLAVDVNGAQSGSGKAFARYGKPLQALTLDLDTGTLTRGPRVSDRKGTTVTDFDNLDLSGFVGLDTGNGFCRWIDAARTAGTVAAIAALPSSTTVAPPNTSGS